jgi:hypothetical protein
MTYQLNQEQQRIVDNANELSAHAAKFGHVPSSYFLDKCNSEAGVESKPLKAAVEKSHKSSSDL